MAHRPQQSICFIKGPKFVVWQLINLVSYLCYSIKEAQAKDRYVVLDNRTLVKEGTVFQLRDFLQEMKMDEERNAAALKEYAVICSSSAKKPSTSCLQQKIQVVRDWFDSTANKDKCHLVEEQYGTNGIHMTVLLRDKELHLWIDDKGAITNRVIRQGQDDKRGRRRSGWTLFRHAILAEGCETQLRDLDDFRRLSDYDVK